MVLNFQLFLFLLCSQKSNSPSLETGLSKWKVLRNAALNIGAEGLKKIFLKVVSMFCFAIFSSATKDLNLNSHIAKVKLSLCSLTVQNIKV